MRFSFSVFKFMNGFWSWTKPCLSLVKTAGSLCNQFQCTLLMVTYSNSPRAILASRALILSLAGVIKICLAMVHIYPKGGRLCATSNLHRKPTCYNICIGVCCICVRCCSLTRYYSCSMFECNQDLALHVPVCNVILLLFHMHDSTGNCDLLGKTQL